MKCTFDKYCNCYCFCVDKSKRGERSTNIPIHSRFLTIAISDQHHLIECVATKYHFANRIPIFFICMCLWTIFWAVQLLRLTFCAMANSHCLKFRWQNSFVFLRQRVYLQRLLTLFNLIVILLYNVWQSLILYKNFISLTFLKR